MIIHVLRAQLPKALEGEGDRRDQLENIRAPRRRSRGELEAARPRSAADAERVERLLGEYRGGGLGVVGATDTLEALSMGQVDELYLTAAMREVKGDREDVQILSDAEVVEPTVAASDPAAVSNTEPDSVIVAHELVTRAQQTSAKVTFIEDPALLAEFGGVGATLRYRI